MDIKEKPIQLYNVVCFRDTVGEVNINQYFRALETILLEEGVYATGPKIIRRSVHDDKASMELLLPVSAKMNFREDSKLSFEDKIAYHHCLYKRVLMEENAVSNAVSELEREAESKALTICPEGCYQMIFSIPDGYVADVYAPVTGEKNDSRQ